MLLNYKGLSKLLPPRILQRNNPIKHWLARLRIHAIRDEVAVPLELEFLIREGLCHAVFEVGGDGFFRVRVECCLEILAAGVGHRVREQSVI